MAEKTNGPAPVGGMEDEHTWSKTIWIPRLDDGIDLAPDEKGLTKELAIEKRAIDDGNENLPRQDDPDLNQTQMQICGRVFKGILLLNEFLSEQLDTAVQAARARKVVVESAERMKAAIGRVVDKVFNEHRPDLKQLRFEELRADRDLRGFRRRNRLVRAAHYRASLQLTIAILVAMFVGESIVNGTLFAEVMPSGWLGGAMLAGLISLINIVLGVFAGLWGWRNLGHRQTVNRVIGGAVTVTFHLAAVVWNLLIAHFREAAELMRAREDYAFEFSELSQATFDHIAAAGMFGMASIPAWALLILGLAIHLIAAKEGWEDLADRYPDYKRHDVTANTAARLFDEGLEALRSDARDAVEEIEEQARVTARRAHAAHRAVLELTDLAKQRRQEILNSEDDWVVTGNRLLKLYRDENIEVRDPGTAPSYFSDFPTAEDYREGDFGAGLRRSSEVEAQGALVKRHLTDLETLEKEFGQAAVQADQVIEEIHRHAAACIRKLDGRLDREAEAATDEALDRLNDFEKEDPRPQNLRDGDEAFA